MEGSLTTIERAIAAEVERHDFPKWFRMEIGRGLGGMVVLKLGNGPENDEEAKAVAALWCAALAEIFGEDWSPAVDGPRIKRAFRRLMATRKFFPRPAEFLEVLPPRPEPERKYLTADEIQARRERDARAAMLPPATITFEPRPPLPFKQGIEKLQQILEQKGPGSPGRLPPPSDKLGRINWLRKMHGQQPFATLEDWNAWAKTDRE